MNINPNMDKEKYIIPNLRNACRLLKWMGNQKPGTTIKEMSETLSIPRTTTLRIVETLKSEDIIRENNRKLFLGPNLISLGLAARSEIKIRTVAVPYLQELTRRTGETSHLAIPVENRSMIVEVSLSQHPLRATSRAGTLVDMHCSATGKIFMAYLYRDNLNRLVPPKGFPARTPNTITTLKELEAEAEKILKRGYCTDKEEYYEGVRCLAVPVFGTEQQVIGAVGITASKQRFPKNRNNTIYEAILETTQSIAYEMGN